MTIPGAGRLGELFAKHGARPTKSLGQNFVIDPNTIKKIVAVAGIGPEDDVLEFGAGAGSLTAGLAAVARSVTAVEIDERVIPILREVVGEMDNVKVVAADAMTIELASLHVNSLVGNLPYNIAAPLVIRALEEAPQIDSLTVMTQREVGERMAAGPGSKAYGSASVIVSYFADARVAARISRNVFWPVPNVDSVLVSIVRRDPRPEAEYARFQQIVRAGFAQRRKTLRNTLSSLVADGETAHRWITEAGLDPGARAETIPLEGFLALAQSWTEQ